MEKKKIKVFGLGLNKTGTTTLGESLKVLGYLHQSARPDLLAFFRQGRISEILNELESFDSFADWPFPLMYKQLLDHFGDNARYILTTRTSAEKWLESLKKHSLRSSPDRNCRLLAYGHQYPHGYEKYHLQFYQEHNEGVRKYFASKGLEHLLLEVCWENSDGWKKLCGFLEETTPQVNFPKANTWEQEEVDAEIFEKNKSRIRFQLLNNRLDLQEDAIDRLLELELK